VKKVTFDKMNLKNDLIIFIMHKIHILISLLFFFMLFDIQAYSNQNFNIKYLTTKQGLSNNYVTCGCEDPNGFIWFGTRDGLSRWDGYGFKVFKTDLNDPFTLPDNFIRSIASDKTDNLWIGTNQSGAVRYNLTDEKFYTYPINYDDPKAFPSPYIMNIFVDNDSTVWFGSYKGLVKYVKKEDIFQRVYLLPENKLVQKPERVISIFKIDENSFGIQSDIGLFKIENDVATRLVLPKSIPQLKTLYDSNPVFFSRNKDVWFADPEVLYHYDKSLEICQQIKHNPDDEKSISSNDASGIFQDSQDNIWITTWGSGVNLYDAEHHNFVVFSDQDKGRLKISNNIITNIFEDHYHNIWFTTEEGGVSYINITQTRIQFYEHDPFNHNSISNNKVGTFLSCDDGSIWIGTGNGGLNKFLPGENSFQQYIIHNQSIASSILGIAKKADESYYVTGWGLGLFLFNNATKQVKDIYSTIPGINKTDKNLINIKGFSVDDKGYVWLATHSPSGLNVYDPQNNCLYNSRNPGPFNSKFLSTPYPVSVFQDSRHRMWITSYSGLYMFDDGSYHVFKAESGLTNSLSSNYIYSIFEDRQHSIWIGSSKGLDKLITEGKDFEIQHLGQKYQLPENVKSIISDNDGNLWLSSNLGITRFDLTTNQTKYFQFDRDVPVQEFVERACLKTRSGELLFGTTNGFMMFHPDSLSKIIQTPSIYFTDFKIFNISQHVGDKQSPLTKSIIETDTIKLTYKQSVISLEYVALNINSQSKIEYAYKMEGVDIYWNFVGNTRFTTYANLTPGEYIFRVCTTNGRQIIDSSEARLYFIISPPFWKTVWAYIVYTILLLFLMFVIQMTILFRIKLKNDLKVEKLKMKNLHETNLMKLRFFTNISHEFRTPLTLIKAPIEKLILRDEELSGNERKYHYQLILNSARKLDKMVNQLMDYRKLEAGSLVLEPSVGDLIAFCKKIWENFNYLATQKGLQYNFNTEIETLFIAFDADKLDKVLSNILSNAFKNTPSPGEIDFTIRKEAQDKGSAENENVEIIVSDTGVGIPAEELSHIFDRFYTISKNTSDAVQGTGIGLTLAKELIEMHEGSISVESTENKGAEFTIRFPVNLSPKEWNDNFDKNGSNEIIPNKESITKYDGIFENGRSKLLIVDDDEEMLHFLKHELKSSFQIELAINGKEGIEKAINEKPDLIISDIMMPLVDGIELCKHLKKNELTSHIPVVLLTARYSQELEIEGLESGANAYILKPFNLEVLRLTITNILNSRKELVEKFKNGTSLYFENNEVDTSDQKLMQKIINLVLDNIVNNKINATFIAERLYVSRTLLYLKIEALTGQTVNEFINNIRLKKAIQLLLNEDFNITEVAEAVGFTSQSYFSRIFAKNYGYSPKDYVKKNK
jgi:signal transduction histidine kinase/ligand-binding sensor domain-containing protein/DNA-binding response OmpR family regulator